MDTERTGRYQLRHAAGVYWLIDMEQDGVPFQKPVCINEAGALIWQLLEAGQADSIVDRLCEEYPISPEEAAEDAAQFRRDLEAQGISI